MTRARYIPELLQTHAEELAFLWGQRKQALHSPELTQRDYAGLCERVEAHTQGLLCVPVADLLESLAPALAGRPDAEADDCFAAAYALLRSEDPAALQAVLQVFAAAQGPALRGLLEALATAPATPALQQLQLVLDKGPPAPAAAAAAVLSGHRLLNADNGRLLALLADPDPAVALWAWRAAARAGQHRRSHAANEAPTRFHAHALGHSDATVRDAGWSAVVWSGQATARAPLREAAAAGEAVALRWLAVLGEAEDVAAVHKGVMALGDGPARCALLARHGHPSGLNALLRWMQDSDEATQVAAGVAFELITGIDVRGERRELSVPPEADDFTRAMAPLAWFPDAHKAQAALQAQGARWASSLRWRRGVDVGTPPTAEASAQLDMQARWDIAARAAFAGASAPLPPLV